MSTAAAKWPIFQAKLKSRDLVAERTMAFHFENLPALFSPPVSSSTWIY